MNRRIFSKALLLAGLTLSWFVAGQVSASDEKRDCHVLSVGVNIYKHINDLQGCANDARDYLACLKQQQGKLYQSVHGELLVDGQATREAILKGLKKLEETAQRPGDHVSIFLSGHGSRMGGAWYFCPTDIGGPQKTKGVDSADVLRVADVLAQRGLRVSIVIDACFAGQMRREAQSFLEKRYPAGAGIVLMLSSIPQQTSADLGRFSAFARALTDGLLGEADLDGNGQVTIRELRHYSYRRLQNLLEKTSGFPGLRSSEQDSEILPSLSMTEDLVLAHGTRKSPRGLKLTPVTGNSESIPVYADQLHGLWKFSVTDRDIRVEYTLFLNAKTGRYEAAFRAYRDGRLVIANEGNGEFHVTGGVLHLVFESGVHKVVVKVLDNGNGSQVVPTSRKLTIQFGTSTHVLQQPSAA